MIYVVLLLLGVLVMDVWLMNRDIQKMKRTIDNIARDVAALRSRGT